MSELIDAAFEGNIEKVETLLGLDGGGGQGVDVNIKHEFDYTTLHFASRDGYTKIVELLIKSGADVNIKDKYGNTALHLASQNNHLQIIELLINAGTILDIQNDFGWTALNNASDHGYTEIVKLLIESGADPDIPNENGKAPINNPMVRQIITDLKSHHIAPYQRLNFAKKQGISDDLHEMIGEAHKERDIPVKTLERMDTSQYGGSKKNKRRTKKNNRKSKKNKKKSNKKKSKKARSKKRSRRK